MRLIDIYHYDHDNLGSRIAIKDVSKADFDKIIKLIKKLDLKRDLREERSLKEFAKKNLLSQDDSLDNKYEFLYKGKDSEAGIIYNDKSQFLTLSWYHPKISAQKLIEMIKNL